MDYENIRPLGDRVLVYRIVEETTKGGLFIPKDVNPQGSFTARVIAVGPGSTNSKGDRLPIDVQPGDLVVLHIPPVSLGRMRPSTNQGDPDAENVFLVPADQILAVMETLEK